MSQVPQRGAADSDWIDADVAEEAVIFGGDRCVDERPGETVGREPR